MGGPRVDQQFAVLLHGHACTRYFGCQSEPSSQVLLGEDGLSGFAVDSGQLLLFERCLGLEFLILHCILLQLLELSFTQVVNRLQTMQTAYCTFDIPAIV